MFNFWILATGVVIAVIVWRSYHDTRDPLQPCMYLGPLLLYAYCVSPYVLQQEGYLNIFFPHREHLDYVGFYNFCAVAVFLLGAYPKKIPRQLASLIAKPFMPNPELRSRLARISYILGGLGLLTFLLTVLQSGGLGAMYGTAKGGARGSVSGYLGDGPLLTLPALVVFFMTKYGERWQKKDILWLVLLAAPHLIHGFLGARRGPTFIILLCLLLPWFVISSRRPSLRAVIAGGCAVVVTVVFLYANRSNIYIGTEKDFETISIQDILLPEGEVDAGNTYIHATGVIKASDHHDFRFWGRRYLVTFFVRPIPRQLWPDKYEDTGMAWVSDPDYMLGMKMDAWADALGWLPLAGAASGFAADIYLEFWWFGLILIYFYGLLFSYCWRLAVIHKGVWSVLYIEACILSIYVPTQSFSAFAHRFLFMTIPTLLLWRFFLDPFIFSKLQHVVLHDPSLEGGHDESA